MCRAKLKEHITRINRHEGGTFCCIAAIICDEFSYSGELPMRDPCCFSNAATPVAPVQYLGIASSAAESDGSHGGVPRAARASKGCSTRAGGVWARRGVGGPSRVAKVLTAARVAPAPVVPEGTPNARVVVDKFLFFILAHFCYPLLALDHPPVLRVFHILLGLPVLERSWQLVFRVLLPQSPDT
jgi:hypothetical protein